MTSLRDRMSFHGRVAIVTGGSAGIGLEAAVALRRLGAAIVIVGRNQQRLDEAARLIADAQPAEALAFAETASTNGHDRGRGESAVSLNGMPEEPTTSDIPVAADPVLTLALDVRNSADMQTLVDRTIDRFGRIDVLVHSAGVLRGSGRPLTPLMSMRTEEWDEVLDINLKGTYLVNRAVLPVMLRQRGGDIVNLSSRSGIKALAYDSAYCASKFGVIGFTEAVQEEVERYGVRIQSLLPGPFETGIWSQAGPIPRPGALPPPSRIVDALLQMLSTPRDFRWVSPLVEPLQETQTGWRTDAETVRPARRKKIMTPETPATKAPKTTAPREEADAAEQFGEGLQGRVILVTGGTGGIGFAVCRVAAELGATVVMADMRQDRIDERLAELPVPADRKHLGLQVDVGSEADVQKFTQTALDTYGRIDALVACAGILRMPGTPPKPLVDVTEEEWDLVLKVNLKGIFLTNRAVLPAMIKQREGTIVNVSSISGLEGRANDGPYCASKFGVMGLTNAVAEEVRSYGIKVQAICPHAVDTPMWAQNHPVPMPKYALPVERVADLIIFMLTQPHDTVLVNPVIAPLRARRRKGGKEQE